MSAGIKEFPAINSTSEGVDSVHSFLFKQIIMFAVNLTNEEKFVAEEFFKVYKQRYPIAGSIVERVYKEALEDKERVIN